MKSFGLEIFSGRKAIFLLMAAVFVFSLLAVNNSLDTGDAWSYLVGAKAIALGQGYTDISNPFSPPLFHYPPAFSAVLAGAFLLFGESYFLAKLVSLIFATLSIGLIYFLLEERFGKNTLLITAAISLNLLFLWYSTMILSEAMFLFVSLSAILFFEKNYSVKIKESEKNINKNKKLKGIGGIKWIDEFKFPVIFAILLAFTFFTRSIGITLAIAAIIFLAMKKSWKFLGIVAVIFILLLTPWFYRNEIVYASVEKLSPLKTFFLIDTGYPELGTITAVDFIFRLGGNAYFYFFSSIPETLFSPLDAAGWFIQNPLLEIFGIAISLIFLYGLFSALRKKIGLIEIYTIVYLLMMLSWGYHDPGAVDRFLYPVLPFIFLYFVQGISILLENFKKQIKPLTPEKALAYFLILIIAVSLASDVYYIGSLEERQNKTEWGNFLTAADYIDKNIPQDAVIIANFDKAVYLLTGNKTYGMNFSSEEELGQLLDKCGAKYILLTDFPEPEDAVLFWEFRYEKVFEIQGSETILFKLKEAN